MREKKVKFVILLTLFVVAFALRFYKLDTIPNGYREDETSLGYNAYSILKTGHDEHGAFLPQNFKAFGEYKLPGYIYASVLPIGVFGLNPWGIRFAAAFSGFLTVVVCYFLTKLLISFMNKEDQSKQQFLSYVPLISTFLLAVNPWHLHFSRSAFEVTLANFFVVCGVYLFLKHIKTQKLVYAVGAITLFAATIYTYNIGRLFAPLLFLILLFIFRKKLLAQNKTNFIVYLSTTFVCAIPFIIGAIGRGGFDSTLGTLIFTSAKVQAPLQEFRSYLVDWPPVVAKILFNSLALTAMQYITNIFAHINPSYFFIFGPEEGSTSFAKMGQWYLFELPLVIAGIVFLLKKKFKATLIIFGWIAALIAISSITREPPQATRTFFLTYPVTFCSALGAALFLGYLNKQRNNLRIVSLVIFGCIVSYSLILYLTSYYVRFPIYYSRYWRTADREVSNFIKDNNQKYEKFIIDSKSGFNYTSLLVYLSYPPQKFMKEATWNPDDSEGFTYPTSFGKYEIREIDWGKDLQIPNTLLVTSVKTKIPDIGILKTITLPERPVVFNVGQVITRFPYSEPVFYLIETGVN